MSFLSPGLFGVLVGALALPLIIHLLNKSFPRFFPFPSIQLIRDTMAKRSRLHRWRHWILLCLRTLFLALLLITFLRPVLARLGSDPAAAKARTVLILLDHSVSMEHRGDGPTSRERATHEALKLIDSLGSGDELNILLVDPALPVCFNAFSRDHAEARRFLGRVRPGLGRADLNQANGTAARLLGTTHPRAEVYYLSDFQRKNWANVDFTALPPGARLFFVDVGPTRRDNRAILDARLAQAQVLAGETVPLEVTVGNYSPEPFTGRLAVTVDQKFSFDQQVSIAPWSEGKAMVPVTPGGPGIHLCEVRLPPDALEYDNRFCLSLAVQDKEEVLVATDGPADPRSGAFFLKTALNPYENEAGSLLPRIISPRDLTPTHLAGVHRVFLTRPGALTPEAAAALGKFLFEGGGLIYFLDGTADAANLKALESAIGPNSMPLRLAQRHTAANVTTGAGQVVRGDFKSRYLKVFRGAARQNLGLLEFYDYYQAGATGAGSVLLSYADDSPAFAAVHYGRGTLLLLNFSAGELSSNLARQRLFPAWIQDLVKAVSSDEPPPSAYTVGETLHTEVWRSEMRDQDFTGPSGAPVPVKRELTGERYGITFTPDQLGFYTLGAPRPLYAFGVNTSPDEADLRPIDKEALPREFAAGRDARFVAGAGDFEELARGRPVYHWFLLGALLCLVLESGFQLLLRRRAAA